MTTVTATFRDLHRAGCFTMPNAWDAGSARLLASYGFPALGTTSAGIACRLGVEDAAGHITLDRALANVREIVDAVSVPVSADFENAYADSPGAVAENIQRCASTGAAGCSIEDWDGDATYPLEQAVERVAAAVEAANGLDTGFVVTARAEQLLHAGPEALEEVVERLGRYAAAGAHCVYAPGMRDPETIREVAATVGAPLNVLVGIPGMRARAADMEQLGVRRLSVGGSLVRTGLAAVAEAAGEMAEGRFDFPDRAILNAELQARFGRGS